MTLVQNIFIPVISAVLIIGFSVGILWMIYRFFQRKFPDINFLWLKYSVFRRKYNEGIVEVCNNFIEEEKDEIDVEKKLLVSVKGISPKEIKEIVYIFLKLKKLKGGNIN